MNYKKIIHLTSVHPRNDTRIFFKECKSLSVNGYDVYLVVADGLGNKNDDNVNVVDVGKPKGRLERFFSSTRKVFKKAVELDGDIYHLHDPELLFIALKLKRIGKKVIFDAHEDVPKQILGKPYLNKFSKIILSYFYQRFEVFACKRLDAIITATPFIREKFEAINPVVMDVNNFPILGELSTDSIDWGKKSNNVCYVGAICEVRGIAEMVQALDFLENNTTLLLGGKFSNQKIEARVKGYTGWQQVSELGIISRAQVKDVLSTSFAGLVTLRPIINYVDALPVKMFEYMSAGVPVIASNFPLWKDIIISNECGLCVDPLVPEEIAEAIDYLFDNPDIAKKMGHKGAEAVLNKYNWGIEELKLLELYKKVLVAS
jgi:glycosyltransferase involved in cell wall biosynthesis